MTVLASSNLFFAWKAKKHGVTSAGSRRIIDMIAISGLRNGVMTFSSRTLCNDFGLSQTTRHRALTSLVEAGVIEVEFRYDASTGRQTTNSLRFVPATHEEMIEYAQYLAKLGEPNLVVFYDKSGVRSLVHGWHSSWVADDVQDRYEAEKIRRGGVVGVQGYVPGEAAPNTRAELDEALPSKKGTRSPENGDPLVGGMAPLRGRGQEHTSPTGRLASLGAGFCNAPAEPSRPEGEGGAKRRGVTPPPLPNPKRPRRPRAQPKPQPKGNLHDTQGVPKPGMTLVEAYGGMVDPNILESFDDVYGLDLASRKMAEEISPGSSMLMKLPPSDPQKLLDMKKKISWLGGAKKVLAYLGYLMKQGLDWIGGFGWTDIDLYAIFCFGAIKEWRYALRIEQGRTTQKRAVPLRLAAATRASSDEWVDDGSTGW